MMLHNYPVEIVLGKGAFVPGSNDSGPNTSCMTVIPDVKLDYSSNWRRMNQVLLLGKCDLLQIS